MALASTGITTSLVGTTLGTTNRNVGGLCSSTLVNPWSRWKPIISNVSTMTLAELKNKNYGLYILKANNPTNLMNQIKENDNIGFTYNKPTGGILSPYRLGDFRNYEHSSPLPLSTTYKDGDTQNIGGVTSSNHSSYEVPLIGLESTFPEDEGNTPHLTKNDLYYYYDSTTGENVTLHRGAAITDGTKFFWYSKKIYWWTTNLQQFKNKTVQIYEFMTNAINTPDDPYSGNINDVFMALPYPVASVQVKSDALAGSQKVAAIFTARQDTTIKNRYYWELQFSAIGDVYRGGTVTNVWVKMCKDNAGLNPISSYSSFPSSITITKGSTSDQYYGTMINNSGSSTIYFCLWYDNQLQKSIVPLMIAPIEPEL